VEILAALVAGLLALVGGYFGAWASRHAEYEKWLRQERSAAFAAFLRELHKTWLELPHGMLRNPAISPDADRYITQSFVKFEPHKNIVRLYLDEKDRDPFSELVHEIWVAQTSSALSEASRSTKTQEAMLAIQRIFESRLHG
jgi:hypothetical protein